MKDELRIELDKLFEKHGFKRAIVLLEQKDLYRVLAMGGEEDGECQYAHLFEGCVNVSEGLRGILPMLLTTQPRGWLKWRESQLKTKTASLTKYEIQKKRP